MIFSFLGSSVRRFSYLWLAGWVLLLVVTWRYAPAWETIAIDGDSEFLPADARSRQAEEVFKKAFPNDRSRSNIVLVLHRADDSPERVEQDKTFLDEIELDLRKDINYPVKESIQTTKSDDDDPFATKPVTNTNTNTNSPPPSLNNISIMNLVAEAKKGNETAQKTLRQLAIKSEWPEQQVAASDWDKISSMVLVSRIDTPNAQDIGNLLVSKDHKVFLIVIGLTTEFMVKDNQEIIKKVEKFVRDLQEKNKLPAGTDLTITGSAVIGRDHREAQLQSAKNTTLWTVILVVILLLLIYRAPLLALIPLATVFLSVNLALNVLALLAELKTIRIIPGYPFEIVIFAGMDIYIIILAYGAGIDYCLFLTARYKEELDRGVPVPEAIQRAVGDVGAALTASAATVICGIAMMAFAQFGKFHQAGLAIPIVLLLVLAATMTFTPALLRLAGPWAFWPTSLKKNKPATTSGDSAISGGLVMGELSLIWQRVGAWLLRRPGMIWLSTIALMTPFAIVAVIYYNDLSYDIIGNLPATAPSVAGSKVLKKHFAPGFVGPTTVVLINHKVDFSSGDGKKAIEQITKRLADDRDKLGLYDVRSYTAPLGVAGHAPVGPSLKDLDEAQADTRARKYYTNVWKEGREDHREVARLDLVLKDNPFAQAGFHDLDEIQNAIDNALPADMKKDTEVHVIGTTASVRDLAGVMKTDRTRIELLVLASVFLVLIVLLRRFVVTVYLLVSVLFSYYVTLGVTIALFWALDPSGFIGIDWKVAIFLFTILIAVGEDYNIFLITRIHEEDRRYNPMEAVTHALTRTGPIISSCGLIMAGTFGSLLAGSLTEMKELGFALTFGVLLDTFVVRPILVPSFLLLLRSGKLSPAYWFRRNAPSQPSDSKLDSAKSTGIKPSDASTQRSDGDQDNGKSTGSYVEDH